MRRSMLFMPGSKPGNLLNGDAYGADSIIIDLEDAVALAEKDSARILTKHALRTFHYQAELIIRINALTTPFWQADLEAIVPEKPDVIMPSKIYTADDIHTLDAYITKVEQAHGLEVGRINLLPLMETTASIENAYEIARSSPRVVGLYLGAADLSLDMKATRTKAGYEIAYARSRLVTAARAAGIDALDTPYTWDIHDDVGLAEETRMVKNMGFNGKACIYPGQVELVNQIFAPTQEEYERSLAIVKGAAEAEAQGKGVVAVNGELVDGPVILMAQNTVREYEMIHGGQRQ